jgi:hypothetical protein
MFPRLREQFGTALDLIVEFSTLGEYRLGADCAHGAASAPAVAPGQGPQLGGAGEIAERAAVRRIVAGGATGMAPVATPAARRLAAALHAHGQPARLPGSCRGDRRRIQAVASSRLAERRRHPAAPAAPEQLCFAL